MSLRSDNSAVGSECIVKLSRRARQLLGAAPGASRRPARGLESGMMRRVHGWRCCPCRLVRQRVVVMRSGAQ